MAPLTCELWQDWCSVTFSDLWSQQGEDPWGTPATVSLSDLHELSKNFLSNHVLLSHRKPRWVIASCRNCIQSFDFRRKISLFSVQKACQQRKHKYCEKKAVDTHREEQNKKTYNCFDLWVPPLFLPSARWDELQCIVKVVDTYNANVGARELHPAHNHCTRSTDEEEVRSQKPWRLLFPHKPVHKKKVRSELKCKSTLEHP
jgi:hypothetical protein